MTKINFIGIGTLIGTLLSLLFLSGCASQTGGEKVAPAPGVSAPAATAPPPPMVLSSKAREGRTHALHPLAGKP